MRALERRGGFFDVSDRPLGVETGVEGPASSIRRGRERFGGTKSRYSLPNLGTSA